VLSEASREAALLVVGGHGANGFADAVPGPVTQRVVADAHCPVLVVPAIRDGELGPVVAAVDFDETCEAVLDFAFAEARWRDAALDVVHVWEEPWNLGYLRHTSGLGTDITLIENDLHRRLAEVLKDARERHPGVEPAGRIEAGSAARTLIRASRSAELVVVGARRWSRRRHRQWIGPVAQALLHRSECPVAVVPSGRAPE
jgi:nucleotide-binding universal stress UspA family protein